MGFLNNLIYSFKKQIKFLKEMNTWRKHGSETRYHYDNPDFNIGEFTYGVPLIRVYDIGVKLTIGKYCSIANDVKILLGGAHYTQWASTYPFYLNHRDIFTKLNNVNSPTSKDTVIGNDVWIGNGAVILSGKTIGDGAVIGAGTIVSKDIPPYAIAVGNPVRIIRYRFDSETIKNLQESEWWDLPPEIINTLLPYLSDPAAFASNAQNINKITKSGGGNITSNPYLTMPYYVAFYIESAFENNVNTMLAA